MKKIIFLATVLSLLFISCGGSKNADPDAAPAALSPKAFNETAMKVFTDANNALSVFDAKITAGVKSKDMASITAASETAMTAVDAQIEKLKAVTAPEGGEAYKDAVLKALDGVKSVIETGKKYGELKEGYSKTEFSKLEKEYNDKRTKLSAALNSVATAHKAFSK